MIETIDEHLGKREDEKISAGEAIAGMILNGLGFTKSVLSLSPMFFENRPLELLFREGIKAEHFNHYKLGRTLEECCEYGAEFLFSELVQPICKQERVDTRFLSLDTTSLSVSGRYENQSDKEEVQINLGYSKDHRPDLKQVVLEMMVTQDGGIPLIGKCFSGNASDNNIFEARSKELREQFKTADTVRYLVLDSKGYTGKNAENLKQLQFITRVPNSIKLVGKTIDKALDKPENWERLDDGRMMQTFEVEHYGI